MEILKADFKEISAGRIIFLITLWLWLLSLDAMHVSKPLCNIPGPMPHAPSSCRYKCHIEIKVFIARRRPS
jgi:hypothetical protein